MIEEMSRMNGWVTLTLDQSEWVIVHSHIATHVSSLKSLDQSERVIIHSHIATHAFPVLRVNLNPFLHDTTVLK